MSVRLCVARACSVAAVVVSLSVGAASPAGAAATVPRAKVLMLFHEAIQVFGSAAEAKADYCFR